MSSETSPTSPRDNGMSIPTICLDSFNESSSHLEVYFGNSDSESHSNEDHQTFSQNVAHFCSWLSCFGAQKKFVAAVILLAQCDSGFRHAAIQLFQPNDSPLLNIGSHDVVIDDTEFNHIASLQWSSLAPTALVGQLWVLLTHLTSTWTSSSPNKLVPSTPWKHADKSSEHEPVEHFTAAADQQRDRILGLKKHYLRLFSELFQHHDSLPTALIYKDESVLSSSSECTLKESVVQAPVGQMLLKTLLHPLFTVDERNHLFNTIRTHRQSACPDPSKHHDEPCAQQHGDLSLPLRYLDAILELASDVLSVAKSLAMNTEQHISSLSHSLTSSGFLSGGGESGSQYDLLSEATNYNGNFTSGSQYGTLLTVPAPDCRSGPNHMVSSPSCHSAHLPWNPGLEQRRSSDGSCILETLSTGYTPTNTVCVNSNGFSGSRSGRSVAYDSRQGRHSFSTVKETFATGIPLQNSFTPDTSAGTTMEQAGDSVSLSSASSTFSCSLECATTHRQASSLSPSLPPNDPSTSAPKETVSLPPSPSGMAILNKNETHFPIPSSIKTAALDFSVVPSVSYTSGCNLHGSEPNFVPISQSLYSSTMLPVVCSSTSPRTSSYSCWAVSGGCPTDTRLHAGQTVGGRSINTYSDPNSGMGVIPAWLKSLRLHKYAGLFERLTYDEFMNITEAWLESHNVTQGARTKLLLNIRKLAIRGSNLSHAENSLIQAPPTGPGAIAALQNCLTEVWNVLQTPLKPCSTTPGLAEEHQTCKVTCPAERINNGTNDDLHLPVTEKNDSSDHPIETQSHTFIAPGSTVASSVSNPSLGHELRESYECLPSQIMNCLTKVCSRLLVSSQPDSDCFVRFVQLLDIIGKHPAFLDKHKSLTASWKQQLFALEHSLSFHPGIDPSRPSHSVPRTHHGIKPSRWNPTNVGSRHQHMMRKPAVRSGEFFCAIPSVPHSSSEKFGTPTQMFFPEMADTHEKLGLPIQNTHSISSERVATCFQSADDNICRRHSVPINQPQVVSIPMKSCPGRRMPSPNPGCMSSRHLAANVANPTTTMFRPSSTQASSDVDVSRLSGHFMGTRFPSPSGFDRCLSHGLRRALVPPATAPPTRMPSPSDVKRQHFFPVDSASPISRPVCPSSTGTSRLTLDETHMHDLSRSGFAPHSLSNLYLQQSSSSEFGQQPFAVAPYPKNAGVPIHRGATPLHFRNLEADHQITTLGPNLTYTVKPSLSIIPPSLDIPDTSTSHGPPLTYVQLPGGEQSLRIKDHRVFQSETPSLGSSNYANRSLCSCNQATTDEPWFPMPNPAYMDTYALDNSDRLGGVGQQSVVDDRMEYIEHDLELLTRNVTELAIGDFDSPVE